MRLSIRVAAFLLAAVSSVPAANAHSVFVQDALVGSNMITPGSGFSPTAEAANASGTGTTGFYNSSYADNFILATTATISQLQWTGFIENYPGNVTDDSNIAGFQIQFFLRDAVDPYHLANAPLYSQTIDLAHASPTVEEATNIYGTTTYNFSATLATPQTFTAGQEYFVAINAILSDPNNASYFWSSAATSPIGPSPDTIAVNGYASTDNYSYAVTWNGQFADPAIGFSGYQGLHDLAFTLSTADAIPSPVPLPTSLAGGLLLLATLGIAKRLHSAVRAIA